MSMPAPCRMMSSALALSATTPVPRCLILLSPWGNMLYLGAIFYVGYQTPFVPTSCALSLPSVLAAPSPPSSPSQIEKRLCSQSKQIELWCNPECSFAIFPAQRIKQRWCFSFFFSFLVRMEPCRHASGPRSRLRGSGLSGGIVPFSLIFYSIFTGWHGDRI